MSKIISDNRKMRQIALATIIATGIGSLYFVTSEPVRFLSTVYSSNAVGHAFNDVEMFTIYSKNGTESVDYRREVSLSVMPEGLHFRPNFPLFLLVDSFFVPIEDVMSCQVGRYGDDSDVTLRLARSEVRLRVTATESLVRWCRTNHV